MQDLADAYYETFGNAPVPPIYSNVRVPTGAPSGSRASPRRLGP